MRARGWRFYGLERVLDDPTRIVRVWEGGLSFHGGLLGVLTAAASFAQRRRLPYLELGEGSVVVLDVRDPSESLK